MNHLMLTDLVTITCNKDKKHMQLQAESIQKFLDPCTHWVVINEEDPDLAAWEEYLSPYYTNHVLLLIKREHLLPKESDKANFWLNEVLKNEISGYRLQNVLKLQIAQMIQKDYLTIDTKNFFVKSTSIDEWNKFIGGEFIEFIGPVPDPFLKLFPFATGNNTIFEEAIISYAKRLGKETPKYYFSPKTPFKICYDALIPFLNDYHLCEYILFDLNGKLLVSPSEYAFYSLLVQDRIQLGTNTIKRGTDTKADVKFAFRNSIFEEDLKTGRCFGFFNSENLKVLSFHRNFLNDCDPGHIKSINNYLRNRGFTFQY